MRDLTRLNPRIAIRLSIGIICSILAGVSLSTCDTVSAQNTSLLPDVQGYTWTDIEGNTITGDFIDTQGTLVKIRESGTGVMKEMRCSELIRIDQLLICRWLDVRGGEPYVKGAQFRVWRVASDGRQFIGRIKTVFNGELVVDQRSQELSIRAGVLTQEDQQYLRERIEEDDVLTLDRLGDTTPPSAVNETQAVEEKESSTAGREYEPTYDPMKDDLGLDDTRRNTFADKANSILSAENTSGTNWMNLAVLAFAVSVILLMGLIAWRHIADSFADTD